MLRPRPARRTPPPARRGAVLLVVLVLLALFAVIGLSFVLYAESEATAARINRESVSRGGDPLPEAQDAINLALGQFIYGVSEGDPQAVQSGLRGYSLGQTMYPFNYGIPDRATFSGSNLSPFSGQGLFTSGDPNDAMPIKFGTTTVSVSRATVVNYAKQPNAGYVIDPEYAWFRNGGEVVDPSYPGKTANPNYNPPYRSMAAAYTFPDQKDYYLAVFDTSDLTSNTTGRVVQPSFFRTYGTFGSLVSSGNATTRNPHWFTAQHRLAIVRPRPADQLLTSEIAALPTNPNANGQINAVVTAIATAAGNPGGIFPFPPPNPDGTVTGDVQNLPNAQGVQHNDAIWIYPGGPVKTWRGKQYVAMVAPTVVDLSGRVNLSVAGNNLGTAAAVTPSQPANAQANKWLRSLFGLTAPTPVPTVGLASTHGSYAGVGPYEINPRPVLALTPDSSSPAVDVVRDQRALLRILGGGPALDGGGTTLVGRYGSNPNDPGMLGFNPNNATIKAISTPPPTPLAIPLDRLSGTGSIGYNGGLVPPHYGRVDLNASGNANGADRADPVGSGSSPFPQFAGRTSRYFDSTNQATQINNHPAQMNPDFWPSLGSTGRVFSAADMKRLGQVNRAADKPDNPTNSYAGYFYQSDLAKLAPWQEVSANYAAVAGNAHNLQSFNPNNPTVTTTFNTTGNPTATTTDPALLTRMLTTTFSTSLSRPEVLLSTSTGGTARLGPIDLARPLPDYRQNTGQALSQGNVWPSTVPASPTATDYQNYYNYARARRARQNLARDVFLRLVGSYVAYQTATNAGSTIVDGTTVWYDPTTGYLGFGTGTSAPSTPAINFLRQLAQISANVVDYVDPDDINTPFVWNPANPRYVDPILASGTTPIDANFYDPSADSSNYSTTTPNAANPGSQSNQSYRVVYGTELPRLVINEAYAMLGNDNADLPPPTQNNRQRARQNFKMKFWLELHNPLGVTNDPVLSDGGAARLQYVAGGTSPSPAATASYPVYDVVIADNGQNAAQKLHFSNQLRATPGNVTGDPASAYGTNNTSVKLTVNNYTQDAANPATTLTNDALNLIQPAAGSTSGQQGGNAGFYVIGPPVTKGAAPAKDQFPGGDVTCSLRLPYPATSGTSSMVYDAGTPTQNRMTTLSNHTHTVILRRLANPYLPPDPATNPYITTDFLEAVPTRNQVFFTSQGAVAGQQFSPGAARTNSSPSVGRRHPYTSLASGTAASPTAYSDTLTNQFVLPQVAQAGMNPSPTNPAHSFFYANTPTSAGQADTGKTPKWLVHFDRQLLNALELVHVSAVPPAMLTQSFGAWPTGNPPPYPSSTFTTNHPNYQPVNGLPYQWYNAHTIEGMLTPGFVVTVNGTKSRVSNGLRTITDPAGTQRTLMPLNPPIAPNPGKLPAPATDIQEGFLSMALGMLTTRPIYNGSPVGGRENGRVNVNTMPRAEVAQGLFDGNDPNNQTAASAGHYFSTTNVTNGPTSAAATSGVADGFWDRLTPSSTVNPPTQPQAWTASKSRDFTVAGTNATPQVWDVGSPYASAVKNSTSTAGLTVFRSGGPNDHTQGQYGNPLFYNTTNGPANDPEHAQGVMEPLRKAWNSTTATSNSFLVVMTVGFFEVRSVDANGRAYFGQEMYQSVPGDLRQKFVSVVDRSNLGVDSTTSTLQAAEKPWFTSLAEDVIPVTNPAPGSTMTIKVRAREDVPAGATAKSACIYQDGVPTSIMRAFWIGFGKAADATNNNDGEQVTPSSYTVPTPQTGVVTITLPASAITRYHPAGSPVSNVLLGHPGPQPQFDYSVARYQGVVPVTSRVTIPPTQ